MKIFTAIILTSLSFGSSSEVKENIEYRYYQISPHTPQQIKPELMRRSPIREGGGSYNGHTDWYIDWRYQSRPTPQGCVAGDIQTSVRVVHILPALSENVSDPKTIEVFDKFNAALTQHEKNHGHNGLTAAHEIDQALSKIPPQPNCRYLSRMVNDIAQSTVQKYIHADQEYDRTTGNGMTEGAVIY